MGICSAKKNAPLHNQKVQKNLNIDVIKQANNVEADQSVKKSSPVLSSKQDFLMKSMELLTPDKQSTAPKGKFFTNYTMTDEVKVGNDFNRQVCTVQNNITGVTKLVYIQNHNVKQIEMNKIQSKIQFLKKLDHPNIMTIYEQIVDLKQIYIVTEYYNGGNLLSRISDTKNKESIETKNGLIKQYFQQIFAGLKYLHQNNIFHKNLKPNNVLFQSKTSRLIKLVDYSLIRNKTKEEELKDISNFAPELFENQAYSEAADIWACGILLFQMWTKQHPFQADTTEETKENIKLCNIYKPKSWEKIPEDSQRFIHLLLNVKPSRRPSAHACLESEYFSGVEKIQQQDLNIDQALIQIQEFSKKNEFQKLLLSVMINRLLSQSEKERLTLAFEVIDENKDGKVTIKELKKYLETHQNSSQKENAQKQAKIVFEILDNNKNGFIELNEFILAACDTKTLLTQENLQILFKFLDKDQSQQITLNELKSLFLEARFSDDEWKELFNQGDVNQNGKLSYQEFSNLLLLK